MSSVRSDQTEYIWFLQLRNKGLERRLESFESGKAYVNLREKYETELRRVEAVVKDLRHQLTASHEQIKNNRECWFEVFEDMDFQNSSIPSSGQGPVRKKIPNSREKTGRKRGGQTGHKGHRLKQKTATSAVHLPDPEEYLNDPDYYPTKNVVRRQKVILSVGVTVQEYTATVFRNRKTGSRVHAAFPEGYETDVSYDGSVKALAFILANEGNMSAGKIRSVLREVTDGMLDLHREMLHYMNGLSDNEETDPDVINGFESRYDQILQLAKEEYEYDPPSDYYRDGYNLYLRLGEYKEHELLFLHDRKVPSNNSRAERDARFYKRKQKQMIVLRSRANFDYLCNSLSLISTFRHQNASSLYDETRKIFSKKKKRKPRFIPGITAKADVTE